VRARRLFASLGFGLAIAGGLFKVAGCSSLSPNPPNPHDIPDPDPNGDPPDGDPPDGDPPEDAP
jgi:hypothetical protein